MTSQGQTCVNTPILDTLRLPRNLRPIPGSAVLVHTKAPGSWLQTVSGGARSRKPRVLQPDAAVHTTDGRPELAVGQLGGPPFTRVSRDSELVG